MNRVSFTVPEGEIFGNLGPNPGGTTHFGIAEDILLLLAFSALFLALGYFLYRKFNE